MLFNTLMLNIFYGGNWMNAYKFESLSYNVQEFSYFYFGALEKTVIIGSIKTTKFQIQDQEHYPKQV